MARRSARVVDKDLGFAEIEREVQKLKKSQIMIGFQANTVTQSASQDGRVKQAGQSMATIAARNEFGFERTPARPFMRTSFDENQAQISKLIQQRYGKLLDGKLRADKMLGILGQYVVGLIQKKIRQITSPPNAPYTIAIKKSSKPLIDFGQMVRSVTYVVKR